MRGAIWCVLVLFGVSGCAHLQEINVLSKNSVGTGNQVVANRSTTADDSKVGSKMEGGDSLDLDVPLMAPGAVVGSSSNVTVASALKINIFSENKIISCNQVGANRSIASQDSEVESDMKGGDTGNVSVVTVP